VVALFLHDLIPYCRGDQVRVRPLTRAPRVNQDEGVAVVRRQTRPMPGQRLPLRRRPEKTPLWASKEISNTSLRRGGYGAMHVLANLLPAQWAIESGVYPAFRGQARLAI